MKVCRLCLAKDANFSVFSVSTAVKIMACTSVEVDPTDGLPQYICSACRLRLEEYHHFRRRCQAADRKLRRNERIDLEDEDNSALQDVARCTGSACSESNAQWRKQAAKLIRNEINAYKRELLANCKQAVRAEIEDEVRQELEEVLMEQASQQVRLGVLNDLFEEVENFFIRKRNETAFEQFHGSESVTSEIVDGFYEEGGEEDPNPVNVSLVDLVDDEPDPPINSNNSEIPTCIPASEVIVPVPMVEINMTDTQLSHLREEYHRDVFLVDAKSPKTIKRTKEVPLKTEPSQKKVRFSSPIKQPKTPVKSPATLCRTHKTRFMKPSEFHAKSPNCVRCRLRGADKRNRSVS